MCIQMTNSNSDIVVTTLLGIVAWYVVKYCIIYTLQGETAINMKMIFKRLPALHIAVFLCALGCAIVVLHLEQCQESTERTAIAAIVSSVCSLLLSIAMQSSQCDILSMCTTMCKSVFIIMFVSAFRLFPSTLCITIIVALSTTIIVMVEVLLAYDAWKNQDLG